MVHRRDAFTATLAIDRPRSINISLEWAREPGPTEIEHLDVTLPDIVGSALEAVEQFATMCEALVDLIGDRRICRIGIKDGLFLYAGTDSEPPSPGNPAPADGAAPLD